MQLNRKMVIYNDIHLETKFVSRFLLNITTIVLVYTACFTILILIESMDGAILHPGYFGNLLCMCVYAMQPTDADVEIFLKLGQGFIYSFFTTIGIFAGISKKKAGNTGP